MASAHESRVLRLAAQEHRSIWRGV